MHFHHHHDLISRKRDEASLTYLYAVFAFLSKVVFPLPSTGSNSTLCSFRVTLSRSFSQLYSRRRSRGPARLDFAAMADPLSSRLSPAPDHEALLALSPPPPSASSPPNDLRKFRSETRKNVARLISSREAARESRERLRHHGRSPSRSQPSLQCRRAAPEHLVTST